MLYFSILWGKRGFHNMKKNAPKFNFSFSSKFEMRSVVTIIHQFFHFSLTFGQFTFFCFLVGEKVVTQILIAFKKVKKIHLIYSLSYCYHHLIKNITNRKQKMGQGDGYKSFGCWLLFTQHTLLNCASFAASRQHTCS